MLDNSSSSNGSGTGGTGRRRSTFYVTLSENMTANGGTNNSENREILDKTSNTKMSPQKKLSNSSQTLTVVEPEKNAVSRRTSTPKSSSQTYPSKSPSKSSHVSMKTGTKPSPVHAPQPFKACTRTVQGPQLLRLPPPQSPKTPKKSSSLLQLSSIKSPESSSSAQKTGGKPLQLSLSLRRTPSTRTVVVTPRDGGKSSVRKVSLNTKTASTVSSKAPSKDGHKQIPLVVVDQHDSSNDVKTSDTQEAKQPSRQVSKDGGEDVNDAGVHSGKSASTLR